MYTPTAAHPYSRDNFFSRALIDVGSGGGLILPELVLV